MEGNGRRDVPREVNRTPPWRDGDCRGEDISVNVARERERQFTKPIWAKVERLKAEERRRLEEEQLEQERQHAEYMALYGDTFPGIPMSEIYTAMECDAVTALNEQNDKRPLAALFNPGHPFNAYQPERPIWKYLSEETRLLASKVISGEFKHEGGRPKRGSEKNRNTPSASVRQKTHQAAVSVPYLRKALRATYPHRGRGEIGERALYMASKMYGVGEQTIKNYLNLPRARRLVCASLPQSLLASFGLPAPAPEKLLFALCS
jgi:hypothetical protein